MEIQDKERFPTGIVLNEQQNVVKMLQIHEIEFNAKELEELQSLYLCYKVRLHSVRGDLWIKNNMWKGESSVNASSVAIVTWMIFCE
jgi:hypothetical protein